LEITSPKISNAVTKTQAAILAAIIVVAIIAGAGYYATLPPPTTTTTTGPVEIPKTLIIDECLFPSSGVNILYAMQYMPYPDWLETTVYQTLVISNLNAQYKLGKIEFVPNLATDWTVSEDGKTYTFNLREDVKFSSENPFSSYAVWYVMYSWYYLSGNTNNFLSSVPLFDVSKVDFGPTQYEMIAESGLANPTSGVIAMMENEDWPIYCQGPNTIVFQMKVPYLWLLAVLSGWEGQIWDAQYVIDNGGVGNVAEKNAYFNTNPIPGTGPYMVTEVVLESHVSFTRNPYYWGKSLSKSEIEANPAISPGQVDNVIINYKPEDVTRYTDLVSGQAHLAAIKRENFELVKGNPDFSYAANPVPATINAIALNTRVFPLDNVNVRKAIVHAINYDDIIAKAFLGEADRTVGPSTRNYGEYYNPANVPLYDYDTAKAKQYLVDAGYPNGQGLPTITFTVQANSPFQTIIAEIVQQNLAEIGIKVEIESQILSLLQSRWGDYNYNVQHAKDMPMMSLWEPFAYSPDYIAPSNYWTSFVSSYSLWGNQAAYSNPVVDEAVGLMGQTNDEAQILAGLKNAQQQIYNDAPYAWLGETRLLLIDGSHAWNNHLISYMYFDPNYQGVCSTPPFNTIVFVGHE
jgi:ABC-type transport system substrate-binding protein